MNNSKEKVLAWVRSKNPQTIKHRCCDCEKEEDEAPCICGSHNTYSDCSDMGLQELLIALDNQYEALKKKHPNRFSVSETGEILMQDLVSPMHYSTEIFYDLTKNLHEQFEKFYESIFPLIV